MARQIALITNLYPSPERPHFGTFVRNAHESLSARGWNVELHALSQGSNAASAYARFYWRAFKNLVRFKGVAYVHYVSHSALPVIAAKALNWRLRIVPHYHGSDAFPEAHEGIGRRTIKKLVCSLANYCSESIVVPSADFGERVRSAFSYAKPIFVSPSGGVDASVFHVGNKDDRRFTAGFAGRLIAGKGAVVAARVLRDMLDKNASASAIVIGDGEEKASVASALIGLRQQDRLEMTGFLPQDELAARFREVQILLFPSDRKGESLGLVWIEAALCGAVPLVMANGVTEKLIPASLQHQLVCRDEGEMAGKLDALIRDPSMVRSIQTQLVSELKETYDSMHVGDRLDMHLSGIEANVHGS